MDPKPWLDQVRDDFRRSRPGTPRRKVSVQIPERTVHRLDDLRDRLDAMTAEVWGEGFSVTKAHLALAAIEYGLESAEQWLPRAGADVSIATE